MDRFAHGLLLSLFAASLAAAQPVPCEDGFAGEFACENVDLLARLPLNAEPGFNESSSDLWGWTDPVTGTEYAIVNQYDHTAFVDLSDPTAPVVVGTLPAPSDDVARDAKTYAGHAFIGTDDDGAPLQVFDLTRLRDVQHPPVTFDPDGEYAQATGPHNLALNEASGFAYLVSVDSDGCEGSIHFVDVRQPTEPTFAGCYAPEGDAFHDVQCLTYDGPDADHAGREVCFGASGGGGTLVIVDVTDKQNPTLIAEAPYPDPAYAHQGWLTEDGRHFLLNDEFDESTFGMNTRTLVFDVADLDEPAFDFEHLGEAASTDHNLFVHDGHAYQANYTSGLRILDLAAIDAGSLTEAAYFDTHPEGDPTGFDGAFGVYPFFESGIVVVSDMTRGLFVLQPRLGDATAAEAGAPPDGFALASYPNPFSRSATVALSVGEAQRARVAVYDVLGREVAVLHDGPLAAGAHELRLDGSDLPAGSYVVRAAGVTFEAARSVTVVR
jgi:choice-of-anchor B domain-containing protein